MRVSRRAICVLAAAASVFSASLPAAEATWNHDPASDIGPDFWGTLAFPYATCGGGDPFVQVGKKQAPIDIAKVDTIATTLPKIRFTYLPTPFVVENTGHDVGVPYTPGSTIGVADQRYGLLQLHVHAPSEHTVDGRSAAAEFHLVHRDNLLDLAVVGVRVDVGSPVNPAIDKILLNASTKSGEQVVLTGLFDANDILPERRDYYTYSGSLTTPPCSEGVRWFVLKEPVFVSQEAVDHLRDVIRNFAGAGGFPGNSRPVMPLNGRAILEGQSP